MSSITTNGTIAHTCSLAGVKDCTVGGNKMSENEGIPLWDSVTQPLASVLELAFGCHHRKLSRVFTIDGHSYKVCCDCGANFDYSLRTMSVTHRRRLLTALLRLHAQRRRRKLTGTQQR